MKRPHLGALPKSRDNYQPRSRVSPSDRCRSVIWRKGNGTPAEGDQGATSCAKQGEMGQAHPPRDDFGGIGLTWGPVSAKPLIHEWGVAAGPPSPHLFGPAAKRTSCINPHGTRTLWQNVALWLNFRVRATIWPVLRSTPGREYSDLCRWLRRLTEKTGKLA